MMIFYRLDSTFTRKNQSRESLQQIMELPMNRIIILGNSGSGKTWLANKLYGRTGFPVTHLDNLFWEPGGFDRKRSPESVEALIQKSLTSDSWIVEGVFGELVQPFIPDATTLIWLDIPWEICQERLKNRATKNRIHHDRIQSEKNLRNLMEWASEYYSRNDLRSHRGHECMFNSFIKKKSHFISAPEPSEILKMIA